MTKPFAVWRWLTNWVGVRPLLKAPIGSINGGGEQIVNAWYRNDNPPQNTDYSVATGIGSWPYFTDVDRLPETPLPTWPTI